MSSSKPRLPPARLSRPPQLLESTGNEPNQVLPRAVHTEPMNAPARSQATADLETPPSWTGDANAATVWRTRAPPDV